MSWRENLQGGSFREKPFFTNAVDSSFGRRVATHEYPLRDKPYNEDLGQKAKEFTIECFVVGENYMADRDALLEALNKKGAGKLIHPFMGEMQVQVLTVRVREGSSEEGIARFVIQFIEAGENQSPDSKDDTAALVDFAADDVAASSAADFSEQFDVKSTPEFVRKASKDVVGESFDLMQSLPSFDGDVAGLDIDSLMQQPTELAGEIQTAVNAVDDVTDLRLLERFGDDLDLVPMTTPTRLKQAKNQQAIVDLVKTSSLVKKTRLLVNV